MALPRPASPRVLWADLRAFLAQRSRHQWIAAGVAVLMPTILITLFILDSASLKPGPQMIYVESWPANRTDEQIMAEQKEDQARREAAKAERQRQFKKASDQLEKIGI
jgi:hypothetical protein